MIHGAVVKNYVLGHSRYVLFRALENLEIFSKCARVESLECICNGREVPMPLELEKRLTLMAEASNLMLAGSIQAYGRNSKLALRRTSRIKRDHVPLKRVAGR